MPTKKVTKKTKEKLETDEEFLARFKQDLDKFSSNKFAKKYKEELAELDDFSRDVLESADQVKSWKRGPISQTVNLTYIFLGVIIGFSLCAVVVTPIVINSI